MKCNSTKVQNQKLKNAQAKAEAERKAMLDAMTDEEREAFLQKEEDERKERDRRCAKHLAELAVLSSTIGGTCAFYNSLHRHCECVHKPTNERYCLSPTDGENCTFYE